MEYKFSDIEKKWQDAWKDAGVYQVSNNSAKPKYYVLDMFPYPSGAGLHVGHPLGYIASDIYARYKRLKGFNVLHPMGYDAFGLPAEQYAIEHGIHPAVSTENNISNFRTQLDKIGFSFDWDREVKTCNPDYYKWTQWIFLQLFDSFYNRQKNKAERIETLVAAFEKEGNAKYGCPGDNSIVFSADEWNGYNEKKQHEILMHYRLAYCGFGEVNWCEALGTVLANDEVINGVSERGGYPVERKKLRQWYLRITEYADRLLQGLERIDFSDAMKEMQSNWIGKSTGAEILFRLASEPPLTPPKGEDTGTILQSRKTANPATYVYTKELAKTLKEKSTEAEALLWERLRRHKAGHHIRRQHIIDNYIVDFVCLKKRIIIEVDGEYHQAEDQKVYDKSRTEYLSGLGFEEMRFSNDEVKNNIDAVVEIIIQRLNSKPSVGKVSPSGGDLEGASILVYTTRPDTIFGVDFMVISPEHDLVETITRTGQQQAVDEYLAYVKSRNDRERMAEKKITGVFTGAFALNPFNGKEIPVWISEYVLAGYGTGAIMAVPCGDERDFKFAQHFGIPVTNIIGTYFNGEEANPTKDAILENSDFINGMVMRDAIEIVIKRLEDEKIGVRKTNYKMRDAAFSRQRYWGEPFPIVWKDGIAYPLQENELPVELPYMEELKPGADAEGPLSNLTEWKNYDGGIREVNTMPGYAGSSWYFLRYMDPENDKEFCDRKASDYWGQVDLYIGGTEHAVGHLLYSRMWTKALYDLDFIGHDEPYKRLVNQGMIQGSSRFVYRLNLQFGLITNNDGFPFKTYPNIFISQTHYIKVAPFCQEALLVAEYINQYIPDFYKIEDIGELTTVHLNEIHIDVNIVNGFELNIDAFRDYKPEYSNTIFLLENGAVDSPENKSVNGEYICGSLTEKMSKRLYNTVNPNDLVIKYGADTFRMYEMFLGPVEQSKPWDTKGIEGVHRFLRKLWRLFYDEIKGKVWNEEKATDAELKILHKAIKKIEDDTERFSFNTAVSAFMVCVNELSDAKCNKREVLEPLLVLLTPYAPHIAEELWHLLGNETFAVDAAYPVLNEKYLVESVKEYPVSINGKLRTTIVLPLGVSQSEIEPEVLGNEVVQKWLEGKPHKKFIYVPNKMINVVV